MLYLYNAGRGDCFRIRFTGQSGMVHNIMVDSGPATFGRNFFDMISEIYKSGEKIDMIILTHQDEDHIGGLLYTARQRNNISADRVYMNCSCNAGDASKLNVSLAAKQNDELYTLLIDRGLNVSEIIAGDSYDVDGMKIKVISPEQSFAVPEAQLAAQTQLSGCNDRRMSFDDLAKAPIRLKDTSLSNKSSVVFTAEYKGARLLFTGDAFGNDILKGLCEYHCGKKFDYIKLPHHGSVGNITEDWEKIICQKFIILADGVSHPNKQTIAKLRKWNQNISIFSPNNWWSKNFLTDEDRKYIKNGKIKFVETKEIAIWNEH